MYQRIRPSVQPAGAPRLDFADIFSLEFNKFYAIHVEKVFTWGKRIL